MEEKKALRSRCRAQTKAYPVESLAICQRILQLPVYQNAESVLAFYPMKTEPDIRPVLEACLQEGKQLYLPQTDEALQIHPRRVPGSAPVAPGVGSASGNRRNRSRKREMSLSFLCRRWPMTGSFIGWDRELAAMTAFCRRAVACVSVSALTLFCWIRYRTIPTISRSTFFVHSRRL